MKFKKEETPKKCTAMKRFNRSLGQITMTKTIIGVGAITLIFNG